FTVPPNFGICRARIIPQRTAAPDTKRIVVNGTGPISVSLSANRQNRELAAKAIIESDANTTTCAETDWAFFMGREWWTTVVSGPAQTTGSAQVVIVTLMVLTISIVTVMVCR